VLSLSELRRVARVISRDFAGARVERFVQPDRDQLAIVLYVRPDEDSSGRKRVLGFSCDRELARVDELSKVPKAPQNPPAFVSYLRSHLSRARLVGADLLGDERELRIEFEAREGRFFLLLNLFGHRSNLYVLDQADCIKATLRPLAETRPELERGAAYAQPSGGRLREDEDRFSQTDDGEFLAAISAHYAGKESEQGANTLERTLRQLLKRELKSARRRLDKIEVELAEADQASVMQRRGELLKGALGRVVVGASEITLDDYETGEPVTIPLDPKLSAKANLEATFKRYQKLLRRLAKAGGQVEASRSWHARLEGWRDEFDAILSAPETERPELLEAMAEQEELAKLIGRASAKGASSRAAAKNRGGKDASSLPARFRDLPRRLHPRRYVSRDGLEIWVGRNDAGNDYLTTRLARGKDLFFHLDGAPGSHVILRTDGNGEPPNESILDASELAIHFSKQKNTGSADVHVVPIKQVKKPKGAKPGLVWVTGGRSIRLRREESRLERVLGSRMDD
jgi:predicted ribosome quality control (RQC) complex YloA/Tae2 family protein